MDLPLWQAHEQRHDFDVPRPLPSGAAVASIGLLPLVLGLTGPITLLASLAAARVFAAAGGLPAALSYHELVCLRRLADQASERLGDLDRPAEPRGILLVEDLLTSSESPLYARERAGDLRAVLLDCLRALSNDNEAPASQNGSLPASRYQRRVLTVQTAHPRRRTLGGDF